MAWRESLSARAQRWTRRNRTGVASSGVALVAVVIGLVAVAGVQAWYNSQLKQANTRIQRERETAVSLASWFLQGLTEPLKKLADPDVENRKQFASLRQNVVDEACLAYESYMEKNGPDVNFLIHVALLRTASGERVRASEAYTKAIELAESQVAERPADPYALSRLGNIQTHLGLDKWANGQAAATVPHFREADNAFRLALGTRPEK